MQESFIPEPYEAGGENQPEREISEIVLRLIEDLHLGHHRTETVDLTSLSTEGVIDFLEGLVEAGSVVLHGSNVEEPLALLKRQQANDAAKESGNKLAVYGTTDVRTALIYAIFNRSYLVRQIGGFVAGEDMIDEKSVFKVSPEVYELFLQNDPNLTRDGHVYVMNRNSFDHSDEEGAKTEYYSEQDQIPVAICRISKNVGEKLLIAGRGDEDTVFPL